MKYIALLRGINVGGNSIIKMTALKEVFEEKGLENVSTYIQSGNVVFDSGEKNIEKLTMDLEEAILKNFEVQSRIVLRSQAQLKKVLEEVPDDWETNNNLRKYLAFVKEPVTAGDVMKEVEVNEGIDFAKAGQGVIYMSTLLAGLTKSRFTKLATKKIYKDITIRNYNTAKKLLALMEK